jgi:hypothetical protein
MLDRETNASILKFANFFILLSPTCNFKEGLNKPPEELDTTIRKSVTEYFFPAIGNRWLQTGVCPYWRSQAAKIYMKHFIQSCVCAAILTLFASGFAAAQTSAPAEKPVPSLIGSTEEYKAATEKLIPLQEVEVKSATNKLEQLRGLVAEGLVARNELEASEQALNAAQAKLAKTKQQIANADRLIAETKAAEELAKSQAAKNQIALTQAKNMRSLTTPTMLRYGGQAGIGGSIIASLPNIQTFFLTKFGRALPTSAIGQSATHNTLGYDHRNAVDVALQPDSIEGQALISYLQSKGIPFLAFRAAVPGVATGPHIHIGNPSHRLA